MSAKTLMTVENFAELAVGETEDFELIDGELISMPSAIPFHAKVRQNMERRLADYFDQQQNGIVLSEVDCRLSEDTVRRPDVSVFLRAIDLRIIPVPFAPDIAVKVLSHSESAIDVQHKALQYLAAGTREVWEVDFENAEILVRTKDGIRLLRGDAAVETPLLPGFSAAVSKLLAAR